MWNDEPRRRLRGPRLATLACLLAMAACKPASAPDEPPVAPAEADDTASPQYASDAPSADNAPRAVEIAAIAGGWRVVEVVQRGSGSERSQAMLGAIAEIHPETLNWSYKPKGASGLDDLCREPVSGITRAKAAIDRAEADFAPLHAKAGGKDAARSRPHEIRCAGGGSWGPSEDEGTEFMTLGESRLAMRWTGGTVLLLERLERPPAAQDLSPEDYRASDFAQ